MFQSFVKNFLRGLLVLAPAAVTVWVFVIVLGAIDGIVDLEPLVGVPVPGAGLVITVVLVTLAGFAAGRVGTRWLFRALERVFTRLPLVRIVYSSLRDLLEATLGERKRFDRPVLVTLAPDLAFMGFLTREDLSGAGLSEQVAVYFPQSYNFAGNVLIVSRSRVRLLPLDGTAAMTFIVSGGVSGELGAPSRLPAKT